MLKGIACFAAGCFSGLALIFLLSDPGSSLAAVLASLVLHVDVFTWPGYVILLFLRLGFMMVPLLALAFFFWKKERAYVLGSLAGTLIYVVPFVMSWLNVKR